MLSTNAESPVTFGVWSPKVAGTDRPRRSVAAGLKLSTGGVSDLIRVNSCPFVFAVRSGTGRG